VLSAQQSPTALDYKTYRSQIEPIFLKPREGPRCYDCHAALSTRFRLERLTEGATSWNDEQSRRNFEVVGRLVVPSQPLKSRLLLHPLAQGAGGDPEHGGGKFWSSRDDPEWRTLADWVRAASTGDDAEPAFSTKSAALDFQYFKARVEPIFLKQRTPHVRCYVCHSETNRLFHLEKLAPGKQDWSDEQSQRNFQSALQQVVPGDPVASPLLVHPLAPEAGGDPFHSGGRQFASQNDPDWLTLAEWVSHSTAPRPSTAAHPRSFVYVTNSAGDSVNVVDTATNKICQTIRGLEFPHGIAFSPGGERVYISTESDSMLNVVERKTGEIQERIPLSGRPNNIAITKDGGRVLVAIRTPRGAVDVINTKSLRLSKTIPVNGGAHNVYVTPDGNFAVSGSIDEKLATVIDLQTGEAAWQVKFDAGVRPMAFESGTNGSASRIFVQLSGFNGFAIIDFAKRAEIARIKLPDNPRGFGAAEGRLGTPSHGIGVSPDGKSLWVNSTVANAVFSYSLPDLKLLGHAALPEVHPLTGAPTGAVPEWITFTPDSKAVYVSNSAAGSVSVIDSATRTLIAVIPVGDVPKRMNTLVLH